MGELTDKEHNELLMLYNHRRLDVDRTKHDQWTQVSAILLAQAGVAGFSQVQFSPTGIFNKTELISTALDVLMVLGIVLVILHQVRLRRLRNFIERCDKHLTRNSQTLLACAEAVPLYRFLTPLIIIAVNLVVWYFLKKVAVP